VVKLQRGWYMATAKVTPSFVEKTEMGSARVRLQFSKSVMAWLRKSSRKRRVVGQSDFHRLQFKSFYESSRAQV
jgi:hypothetical protein